ncbi:MAG: putative porin [Flavobacterium sp.]|nr:putative porin [Flavobacterium sp.]
MIRICVFFIFLFANSTFGQDDGLVVKKPGDEATATGPVKGTIDQYRIITLEKDTTYVDTSLHIAKEYRFNYLRRDTFGLLPFPNEGQPYNHLKAPIQHRTAFPELGYDAKQFFYMKARDINYYSVATPLTELYFKTVMEQGQMLDAFLTLNTSERLNFSVAYKGLRSLGKYINQLSSAGNFRFTTSYSTVGKRYTMNGHFTAQDLSNGENGGITNVGNFTGDNEDFKNRVRLNVYLRDATSFLKGNRYFIDHSFRFNSKEKNNNLYLTHQFNYEHKFFSYKQATLTTALDDNQGTIQRFGTAFVNGNINDETRYNRMYNKVGAVYENTTLGRFTFFAEDFRYNYYFDKIRILNGEVLAGVLQDRINTVGGQYEYRRNRWRGKFTAINSLSDQSLSQLEGNMEFSINERNRLSLQYQKLNKLPDHLYNLHQSSYVGYNWANGFKNEKFNNFAAQATTQWFTAQLRYSVINDLLYYSDDAVDLNQQIVTPKQYEATINYLSLELRREFRFRKFALDNTVLYQQTEQSQDILNTPKFVTRNTLYFSDYFFKRALYLQTGVIFNYFTEYYANDYNPIIGDFFVQNQTKIGGFPTFDFFVNARIQQTRIFIKAEHFNSAWTGNNFFSTPNQPYRDFIVRFGLVWNFFQ